MITLVLTFATCAAAVSSSVYWFKSSHLEIEPTTEVKGSINDVPEHHIMGAQVDIEKFEKAERWNELAKWVWFRNILEKTRAEA